LFSGDRTAAVRTHLSDRRGRLVRPHSSDRAGRAGPSSGAGVRRRPGRELLPRVESRP